MHALCIYLTAWLKDKRYKKKFYDDFTWNIKKNTQNKILSLTNMYTYMYILKSLLGKISQSNDNYIKICDN